MSLAYSETLHELEQAKAEIAALRERLAEVDQRASNLMADATDAARIGNEQWEKRVAAEASRAALELSNAEWRNILTNLVDNDKNGGMLPSPYTFAAEIRCLLSLPSPEPSAVAEVVKAADEITEEQIDAGAKALMEYEVANGQAKLHEWESVNNAYYRRKVRAVLTAVAALPTQEKDNA
jgi:hypothetical protein